MVVTVFDREKEFSSEGFYVFDKTNKILMCKYCNVRIEWRRKDTCLKHINNSVSHKKNKEKALIMKVGIKRQVSLTDASTAAKRAKSKKVDFILSTTRAFMEANIPLEKVDHPKLREWMNKYIPGAGDLPTAGRLREGYVPQIIKEEDERLKEAVKNEKISILCDETTDKRGKCVFMVLIKVHCCGDGTVQQLYVGGVKVIENANATECSQAIMSVIQKLEIQYQNVVSITSDSARYMTKCINAVRVLVSEGLVHTQCWAHKLNLVISVWAVELGELNNCIIQAKHIFLNTRKRKHAYNKFLNRKYEDDPTKSKIFPIPIITRWNSWFKTVEYLGEYLHDIVDFVKTVEEESVAVNYFKALTPNEINIDTSNDLLNASDKKVFSAHQKSITKYFRRIIINLFRKYEDKPKILKYFLAIPQYFDFELDFMMMVPIIDEIQQIALTSEDIAVLNNSLYHIAVLFNNIPKEGKEYVKGNQDILIERIVYQSFIPTLRKLITSEGTVMNNEIKNCLERTAVLAKYFNLTHTPLVEMVFEALDSSVNNLKVLEIKVFSNICFQIICWKLNGILDILEVDDYVSEEEVETLKVLNHKLFDLTIKILTLDLEERLKSMAFIISWKLLMTFSQRNLKLKRFLPAVIYPSEAKLEWLCYHLTASVPYFFNAEIIPSPEHEYLLSKYCNLLENHVIKSCNIANIVPYFQTEEYIKIVSRPLHILLRDEISMQSTVVSLVYALEVLLTKCQRNEDISEQILQNILDGICTSLHPKYKGLGKAIQEIQIVGLGCIYATQNTTFFKILEFFVPLVRKPKSIEMLKGLIFQHFPHIDRFAVMSYITSLDQIEEALTKEKHSEKVSTEITDDELPSGFSWEVISSASNTSE